MGSENELMPVVGVRLIERRSGSTMLMQLLASSPQVVFDDRYPAEYRFLSYFARIVEMMTEPFDESAHVGITPFFFGGTPTWGPIPFVSEVASGEHLRSSLLGGLWSGWSADVRASHPDAVVYAEKLAVDVESLVSAGIPLRVIDLVRDPRDMLASIRDFAARGVDGFSRRPRGAEPIAAFLARTSAGFAQISRPPAGFERLVVRYEDLVMNLGFEARRISDWLDIDLDASVIARDRHRYGHHVTTRSARASVGRWKRDLSEADADLVAETLRAAALPHGYAL